MYILSAHARTHRRQGLLAGLTVRLSTRKCTSTPQDGWYVFATLHVRMTAAQALNRGAT